MREQDMRRRVEQFMHKRLRAMLMPATLGLGLAVGGCVSDGLNSDDDGGTRKDANADTMVTPTEDGGTRKDYGPFPLYGIATPDAAPAQPDSLPVRYAAQMPDASGPINYPIYMALAPNT